MTAAGQIDYLKTMAPRLSSPSSGAVPVADGRETLLIPGVVSLAVPQAAGIFSHCSNILPLALYITVFQRPLYVCGETTQLHEPVSYPPR